MKSQNLPDIAAMRMTYLMYYVACIYVRDSTVVMDTCACGDNGMRRYTTYTAVLNLILLISRDAIHFWLFAGTLIGLLPCCMLMIGTSWVLRGEHRCSKDDSPRYLPSGYKYATYLCTSFGNNVVFI